MKVLFDVGHPENVHIFKHLARRLREEGHEYCFTTRSKEITALLLRRYGLPFEDFGEHYRSLPGKAFGMVRFGVSMVRAILREKPDLLFSHGSMYAAHAGALTGCPHISLEDTDNSIEQIRLYKPFTKAILTSDLFSLDLGPRQIRYRGYHEIAYLSPELFAPVPLSPEEGGGTQGAKKVLVRITAWEASHDRGQRGLSEDFRVRLVRELARGAEVFVSGERELPRELEPYRLKAPPERIHDFLAGLDLYIGEGATMASECSVLGVPSVYVNTQVPAYIREQADRYGLVTVTTDETKILSAAAAVLDDPESRKRAAEARERLLGDKIRVHDFLYWVITSFPQSLQECRRDMAEVSGRFAPARVSPAFPRGETGSP